MEVSRGPMMQIKVWPLGFGFIFLYFFFMCVYALVAKIPSLRETFYLC